MKLFAIALSVLGLVGAASPAQAEPKLNEFYRATNSLAIANYRGLDCNEALTELMPEAVGMSGAFQMQFVDTGADVGVIHTACLAPVEGVEAVDFVGAFAAGTFEDKPKFWNGMVGAKVKPNGDILFVFLPGTKNAAGDFVRQGEGQSYVMEPRGRVVAGW